MPRVHYVHIGCINHDNKTLKIINREKRHELIYDLNNWFFDYFYANQQVIRSLPPLDDWTRSHENPSMWSIEFPFPDWVVQIWTEPLML
jgi:hypothetical protein